MTQNRYYSNLAQGTTVTNSTGLNNFETDLQVAATVNWPSQFPFIVRLEPNSINEEVCLVTSGAGTAASPYQITRGYDGTNARVHSSGTSVIPGFAQIDFSEPQQHINLSGSASGAHGLPSSAWLGGTMQLIQTQTLASSGVITFTSIPQTFTHLRMIATAVSNDSGGNGFSDVAVQFNSDFGSHYSYAFTYCLNSSTLAVQTSDNVTSGHCGFVNNGGVSPTSGGGVGICIVDIPLYAISNMSKSYVFTSTARSGIGAPNNKQWGSGGGIWGNLTAAISTIKFSPSNSPNTFTAGSSASLYGIM